MSNDQEEPERVSEALTNPTDEEKEKMKRLRKWRKYQREHPYEEDEEE